MGRLTSFSSFLAWRYPWNLNTLRNGLTTSDTFLDLSITNGLAGQVVVNGVYPQWLYLHKCKVHTYLDQV